MYIQNKIFHFSNKIVALFLCVAIFLSIVIGVIFGTSGEIAHADESFKTVGKAAYLIDEGTGEVIYARNENERLPIASMVKIMTTLLTLEGVDKGEFTLDDDVHVSEEAESMGGSQVFLSAGSTHKLKDLLRTVIVASANDSCVALAEHVAGSTSSFVAKMNARAKELGMQNTNFKNCTGLPMAESFSSAKDVSIMFRELIKHPTYFEFSKVWLEDYQHPDGRATTITNTNKLVKFYDGCDGGKTGYTSEAKFCLCATAKREDMRIIAVMIGADSSKTRNAAISKMFDHSFANYSNKILLKKGESIQNDVQVVGGKKQNISLSVTADVSHFIARNEEGSVELKYEMPSTLKAPIKQGDCVGKVHLVKEGVVLTTTDIVANETVERMSLWDAIKQIASQFGAIVNK